MDEHEKDNLKLLKTLNIGYGMYDKYLYIYINKIRKLTLYYQKIFIIIKFKI